MHGSYPQSVHKVDGIVDRSQDLVANIRLIPYIRKETDGRKAQKVDNVEKDQKSTQERVDNLHIEDLRLIQSEETFRYGIDAVLLSGYAGRKVKAKDRIMDIGTGNGAVAIMMSKTKAGCIDGLEIQDKAAEMARRNVILNGLQGRVNIYTGDVKSLPQDLPKNTYNMVVTNPPYMARKGAISNEQPEKAIARHEIACTVDDVIDGARRLLKSNGLFYMIHRPHRLVDIFSSMRKHDIEPKEMILIRPRADKPPNLVLIEGRKGAGAELSIKEWTVYKEDGSYTDTILDIYKGAI